MNIFFFKTKTDIEKINILLNKFIKNKNKSQRFVYVKKMQKCIQSIANKSGGQEIEVLDFYKKYLLELKNVYNEQEHSLYVDNISKYIVKNYLIRENSENFIKFIAETISDVNANTIFNNLDENVFHEKLLKIKNKNNLELLQIISSLNNKNAVNFLEKIPMDIYIDIFENNKKSYIIRNSNIRYMLDYSEIPSIWFNIKVFENNLEIIYKKLSLNLKGNEDIYEKFFNFISKNGFLKNIKFKSLYLETELINILPVMHSLINEEDIVLDENDYQEFINNIKDNIDKKIEENKNEENRDSLQ